jgi:molybdate transport system substrate-binding protein
MVMKKLLIIFGVLVLPLSGIAQKLRIAVAANAQFVAKVLAEEFKRQSGITAELIVSSSGKLTTQIEQGAPFDVFLSADMKYPQELYSKQLTTDKPKVYAYGTLVIWAKSGIDLKKGIRALDNILVDKIAIANAALAPYGEAAEQAMKRSHLFDQLRPKLVYGESIAQVNQYMAGGVVDAVFTAKSVVLEPGLKNRSNWVEVNKATYEPIAQGVVILKSATDASDVQAQKFYDFLFSTSGKRILSTYGYR